MKKDSNPGQGLYVITGTVTVDYGGSSLLSSGPPNETLTPGQYFLDGTLTTQAFASPATYKADGQVTCTIIDRTLLRELVENKDELKMSRVSAVADDVDLTDLEPVATLGVGGFGRVKMVLHPNGDYYALKCMFKGLVIAKRQTEHIMNERRLMGLCRHSFLPHLIATYQDATQIYVLMDLIQGGELFSLVATGGRLYENDAAFYCANVTCALEYLHARNIAYGISSLRIDDR